MATCVSCALPEPVTQLLSETYGVSPYTTLLSAVKAYTQTTKSVDASAAASTMAKARNCTKTDIYREALIALNNRVAEVWPAPKRTEGSIARAHNLMLQVNSANPANSDRRLRAVAATLAKLRDRVPNMRTHQIVSVINQILDRLPKE